MPTNSYNAQQAAEQITRHNYHWGSSIGTAAGQITYGFRTTAPTSNESTYPEYISAKGSFSPFTVAQEQATRAALKSWSDVANITFRDLGDTNSATIAFANYNASGNVAGFANFPNTNNQTPESLQGDVFMNVRNVSTTSVNPGTGSYFVLLHEIGHSLGLEHPGDYAEGVVTYPNSAVYIQDTRQYSVMSYFSEQNTGGLFYALPETPMMDDIAAIQRLYGANMTTRTGDTVYGFNSNAGSLYLLTSAFQNIAYCIWDAGGNDTLDFSGYNQNANIQLAARSFSSVGGSINNISIAGNVVVESAIGGAGNDTIGGNEAANVLKGNAGIDTISGYLGNDTLYGGGGDDRLYGGSGADRLDGGDGFDTADYGGVTTNIVVDLLYPNGNSGEAIGDTIANVEAVAGSYTARDTLLGDNNSNTFFGRGGDDFLNGRGGNDSLYGNDGNDRLDGEGGNDFLVGAAGADQFNGGADFDIAAYDGATAAVTVDLLNLAANTSDAAGDTFSGIEAIAGSYGYGDSLRGDNNANTFYGRGGNDGLFGRAGNDVLLGDAGNDFLVGGAGGDQLNGGADFDIAAYDGATMAVTVDLLNLDANTGDAAGDAFSGIEAIAGTYNYGDTLRGDNSANTFYARGGNDLIEGRGGADLILGESGADTFLFRSVADSTVAIVGRDTIQDFSHAQGDHVDLHFMDANTLNSASGDQAFYFIGSARFTGHAGELRAAVEGSGTVVSGDVNGDGAADFAVMLKGAFTVQQDDFIL